MKIYTKTGDSGETGLFAGPRVRKDDLRIEAYGTVDELNAVLGLVRSQALHDVQQKQLAELDTLLAHIQHILFNLGAELATPDPKTRGTSFVRPQEIAVLEGAIDQFEAKLPTLKTFILPGGAAGAAWLHLARTVCRRAERRIVTLAAREGEKFSPHVLIYLNRLSDLLFVLARAANQSAGRSDVPWEKSSS
ncbi:MAG TPA: cob(I)yrinic acid a,c-diamide adenosyltransferase [Pirellulales bacterium]|jgi:cob(I)alamin adenosyltransferase|nr:cob(I)yrinic acid a,c-diamide adenosyltransferase [Pirellulales bacterium]